MASEQTAQKPSSDTRRSNGEIMIELVNPKGMDLLFDPLQVRLRSRFSRQMLPPGMTAGDTGLDALPDIPGMCVALNVATKTARVFDPLGVKSNEQRLAAINNVLAQNGRPAIGPAPETVKHLSTDNEVATWLYYMRRLVHEFKIALHVTGSAPLGELKDKLPGDPQVDWYSSQFGSPKTLTQYQAALHKALVG